MPQQNQFAFWDLENLFDVANSPRRSEKLQRVIRRSLEGWTQALLNRSTVTVR